MASEALDSYYIEFLASYDQLTSATPEITSMFADVAAGAEEAGASISESIAGASESLSSFGEAGSGSIELIIELLDQIATNTADVNSAVEGMSSAVTGSVEDSTSAIEDLSSQFEHLSVSASASAEATAEASSSAESASSGGFMSLFNQIGFGIMNFQNYINIAQQAAHALLGPAISAETVTSALTTLDGSAQAASQEMDQLNAFAAKTPFKTLDIDQAAEQLQGFGFNAKQVVPTITSIGDALGSVGRDTPAELNSVVDIFGKIHTEGKITQQTMNELAVHGINGWQALADATGKTIPQLKEMVKKGLIPADEAISDLTTGIEKNPLYAGGMARAAGTFTGLLSTLQSNWDQVIAAFGTPIIKALEGSLSNLGNILASPAFQSFAGEVGQGIVDAFQSIGGAVQYVINIFRSLNLSGLSDAWHAIGVEIGSISHDFSGFGDILKQVGTDADPIAEVIQSIAKVGLNIVEGALWGISSALMAIDKVIQGGGLSSMGGVFKQVSSIVGGALTSDFKTFTGIAQSLGNWWKSTMEPTIVAVLPSFERLGEIIITDVVPALAQIWASGQQITRALLPPLTAAFETIAPIIVKVGGFLADNLGQAIQFLTPYLVQATSAIADFATQVITRVTPIVQNLWSIIQTGLSYIMPIWNAVWPSMKEVLAGVWQVISGIVQVAWSLVSGVIKVGLDLLSGNWKGAWKDIQDTFSGVWKGIQNIVEGTWTTIKGLVAGGINFVIGLINDFINGLDKIHVTLPGGASIGFSIPDIPTVHFASGGYLAPGQVGVAGEQGEELIFGGTSGAHVLNHAQSMALLGGSQRIENHVHVYLDSVELTHQVGSNILALAGGHGPIRSVV